MPVSSGFTRESTEGGFSFSVASMEAAPVLNGLACFFAVFFCCAFLLWLRAGGVGIQFSGANCTTQQTCYTDRVPRGWLSCLVLWIGQQCSQRGIFIFQLHRLQGVQVFALTTLIQNIILDR